MCYCCVNKDKNTTTTTNSQSTSVQKPTSLSNSKVAANKSSTNNFLIIPNQSGAGGTTGAGLKMRKSSLQIPAEQLAQAGLLTTQCASSAASTPSPDTKPAIVTASSNSTSTVNWQNYFNSKLTKDKLTVIKFVYLFQKNPLKHKSTVNKFKFVVVVVKC